MKMTEPESDRQVIDLISKKIAAEDADSGWVVAYAAMRVLPVMKDIAESLKTMQWIFGDDHVWNAGAAGGGTSPRIASEISKIAGFLEEFTIKERKMQSKLENEEWKRRGGR
jgi:hypothetical protein